MFIKAHRNLFLIHQPVHSFGEGMYLDNLHARGVLRQAATRRDYRFGHAQAAGFLEPLFQKAHGADLARQSEFADDDGLPAERNGEVVARNSEREGEVRRSVGDLQPAGNRDEHVGGPDDYPAELFKQRQDDGEALRVDSRRHPLRYRKGGLAYERLRLEKHRPRPFHRAADHASGRRRNILLQKHAARIFYRRKPVRSHLEYADFVRCAEAVFDGADQAVLMVAVALEIHDRIDHVLQDARPCDLTVLGDMPDKNRDAPRILREHHQVKCAFAKLRGTSGSPRKVFLIDRLDRIDDEHLRLDLCRLLQNFFEASLAKQKHVGTRHVQALATQLDLHRAFFAAHIEAPYSGGCHGGERGQHQGGLSDSRIATDEHQGTWCKPAPQHPVKFSIGGAQPPRLFCSDFLQRNHLMNRTAETTGGSPPIEDVFYDMLLEATPRPAERTLACPFWRGIAAFGTEELNFFFRFRFA